MRSRRPGLDSVPHCLLHPRPDLSLARPDDESLLMLTTDDEGPHPLTTPSDHLGHRLLLTPGLLTSPHHLDAPGNAGPDHHLAPWCLLPHCGPLSDLTSLKPRALNSVLSRNIQTVKTE